MDGPTVFDSAAAFRAWLERHAATAPDLLVGFPQDDSGLPGMGGRSRPERQCASAGSTACAGASTVPRTRSEDRFRCEAGAWDCSQAAAPGYRRVALRRITTAKTPETRAARLERLIRASAAGERW